MEQAVQLGSHFHQLQEGAAAALTFSPVETRVAHGPQFDPRVILDFCLLQKQVQFSPEALLYPRAQTFSISTKFGRFWASLTG